MSEHPLACKHLGHHECAQLPCEQKFGKCHGSCCHATVAMKSGCPLKTKQTQRPKPFTDFLPH